MITDTKLAGTTILLVEDEDVCRRAVRTILYYEGATVIDVVNAEQAVSKLEAGSFDIVITDIRLPLMDGIGLLNHIRGTNPELPVIIMTGSNSVGHAVEALKLGAQDYFLKPFESGTELVNSIWKAVEHRRLTLKNKSLQEQLKQSEETFRMLFHNASDAIFLHRVEQQDNMSIFTEVNDVACSRLGYNREELLGMTLLDITAEDHRKDTRRLMKSLTESEHLTFETLHLTKTKDRIPVEVSAHLFSLNNRKAVLSIARNITERREMERQIAEASEMESRRMGHELHDVLCQDLASIKMLTSVLKTTLTAEGSKGIHDAELIRDLASNAVIGMRRLCSGLSPSELEGNGLASALEQLAVNHEQIFRIKCVFRNKCRNVISDKSVSLHLYRIAQQAVNNAATHGKATHISISLTDKHPGGILRIDDDGIGIGNNHERQAKGMGIHIMKYRARMIGAVMAISKREKGGTTVECLWQ